MVRAVCHTRVSTRGRTPRRARPHRDGAQCCARLPVLAWPGIPAQRPPSRSPCAPAEPSPGRSVWVPVPKRGSRAQPVKPGDIGLPRKGSRWGGEQSPKKCPLDGKPSGLSRRQAMAWLLFPRRTQGASAPGDGIQGFPEQPWATNENRAGGAAGSASPGEKEPRGAACWIRAQNPSAWPGPGACGVPRFLLLGMGGTTQCGGPAIECHPLASQHYSGPCAPRPGNLC